jgi:pimeloyl-ACP methyl ester carboxylesterase
MTPNCDVRTVDLTVGPIDCVDTGGEGPTVVLLHGVLMNNTVWRGVMAELTPALRCVAPTLPLGAQRQPMRPGADLSVDGIALLVAEFLERRDLSDVALVMNDWGGPQLLVDHGRIERIGRLALVACEAFDNFPPGAPGRRLAKLAAARGGFALQSLLVRFAVVRLSVARTLANTQSRMKCCAAGSGHSLEMLGCARICGPTASACRSTADGTGPQGWSTSRCRHWWSGRRRTR